jgi:hypothetical protein
MANQNRIKIEYVNTIRFSDFDETVLVFITAKDGGKTLRHKRMLECADDLFDRVDTYDKSGDRTIDPQYWRELTSEEQERLQEEMDYRQAETEMEHEQYLKALSVYEGMNGRI